ncbi:MAG: hypothetical protein ACTSP1_14340 [Candidatus Freyarchaeota archaeon]
MGTPFEWVGENLTVGLNTSVELQLMSAAYLKYTAVCLGNHEFDYSDHGLSLILNNTNATLSGNMPKILCSNLDMSTDTYNLKAFITRNHNDIKRCENRNLFADRLQCELNNVLQGEL